MIIKNVNRLPCVRPLAGSWNLACGLQQNLQEGGNCTELLWPHWTWSVCVALFTSFHNLLYLQVSNLKNLIRVLEQELEAARQQATLTGIHAAAPSLNDQASHTNGAHNHATNEANAALRASSGIASGVDAGSFDAQIVELQAKIQQLQSELGASRAEVDASEQEKERLRVQLARLKEQMLREQDEEDDTFTTRLDAEIEKVTTTLQAGFARERHMLEAAASQQMSALRSQHEAVALRLDQDKAELQRKLNEAEKQLSRLQQDADGRCMFKLNIFRFY